MDKRLVKRRTARITLTIIALAAATALLIGGLADATVRKLREEILAELQPVTLKNCTFKRFGSANDGGYLMCENLIAPLDAAYSYGVGTNDDWACEVSRRYHVPVHEYDCFDPARPIVRAAADLSFTTNASEIRRAIGIRISSTRWKTRLAKTAIPAGV